MDIFSGKEDSGSCMKEIKN